MSVVPAAGGEVRASDMLCNCQYSVLQMKGEDVIRKKKERRKGGGMRHNLVLQKD